MNQLAQQCQPFYESAGFARMPSRTQIEISGNDRLAFLHNFCTADIKRLEPGRGTEAFITSVKGKVLGHGFVYCGEESLVFETIAGQAEKLMGHLDRYTLADDVELKDVSDGWAFHFVGGPKAASILQEVTGDPVPENLLDFTTAFVGDVECAYARGGAISPAGFTMCCSEDDCDELTAQLADAGFAETPPATLEVLRVEAGMPLYGVDITEDNLPQEANRNAQAISFTKGCYLGQETVARLDALGHVNKLLVGVRFTGDVVPEPDSELSKDGKRVGKVTSAIYSPVLKAPLALAYVRADDSEAGTALSSSLGDAEVVSLPLAD